MAGVNYTGALHDKVSTERTSAEPTANVGAFVMLMKLEAKEFLKGAPLGKASIDITYKAASYIADRLHTKEHKDLVILEPF